MPAERPASPAVRLSQAVSMIVPLGFGFFGILLGMLPLRLDAGVGFTPLFALMPIYFWGLFRPAILPPGSAFGLGLAQDLLTGAPVGLHALVFMLAFALVVAQRPLFSQRLLQGAWFGFGVTVAFAALALWIMSSIYIGEPQSLLPALAQIAASAIVYPLAANLFILTERRLLSPA